MHGQHSKNKGCNKQWQNFNKPLGMKSQCKKKKKRHRWLHRQKMKKIMALEYFFKCFNSAKVI